MSHLITFFKRMPITIIYTLLKYIEYIMSVKKWMRAICALYHIEYVLHRASSSLFQYHF